MESACLPVAHLCVCFLKSLISGLPKKGYGKKHTHKRVFVLQFELFNTYIILQNSSVQRLPKNTHTHTKGPLSCNLNYLTPT